ncbi:MAG: hypothetical protein KC561_07665 [Myxococcales bacterium]|nr:hypothetical protein [Myxococcales bacterium]
MVRSVFALALALLATTGCSNVGPNDNSRRDAQRAGAQEIPLDTAVTDAINFAGGDATDWKAFNVTEAGEYTMEFFFDNPIVNATIDLHNQYGERLESLTHNVNGPSDVMTVNLREVGTYYLRFNTTQYRSTYSLRVYQGRPTQANTPTEEPRPEFDRPI